MRRPMRWRTLPSRRQTPPQMDCGTGTTNRVSFRIAKLCQSVYALGEGGELVQYYTYRCPHCHAVVGRENSWTKGSEGCPLRTCPNCGKTYIDTNCEEPALRPYKPFGLVACAVTAIVGACAAALALMLLIFAVGYFSGWYGIAFVHVWVSAALGGAYGVFSFLFRKKYLDEENAQKWKAWQESDARLQNPEYARILKNTGFRVPAKYLDA